MTNQEFIESISLPNEEWRDVVGYEGYYVVSSIGRIVSLGRTIRFFDSFKEKEPHLMSDVSNKERYNRVVLKVDGKKQSCDVHRLVATAFIANPNSCRCIDHIDGDKTNNSVKNLRWCSDFENQNNPVTREKQRKTLLQKSSKFAPRKVVGIKPDNTIITYETMCEASKDGHNQAMISECCNGHRKHHHGIVWMYLSDYETLINMSKNS